MKRSTVRRPGLAIIAAGLAVGLAACAAEPSATESPLAEPTPGGVVTIALWDEPNVLDPAASPLKAAYQVLLTMCEGLYTVDENMEAVPQLAVDMPEVSDDGLTVTVPLLTGATFNDGTPFDAAAAKSWLERNLAQTPSSVAADFVNVGSIEAPDAETLVFAMTKPDARLVNTLAGVGGMIASMNSAPLDGSDGIVPICVSPFVVDSWEQGVGITLSKSEEYYAADSVLLDGVEYRFLPDSTTRKVNLQSGDVDVALSLAPNDEAVLAAAGGITTRSQVGIGFQSIIINTGNSGPANPPGTAPDSALAQHPELREAFELAIDRDALVATITSGTGTPGCSMLSPASPYFDDPKCAEFDPERAKEIVEAADVSGPIEVNLLVTSEPVAQRFAQAVQAMVAEVGFDVIIEPVDSAGAYQRMMGGDFDAAVLAFGGLPDPDANISRFIASTGPLNVGRQFTDKSDALIAESVTTIDPDDRRAVYADLLDEIRSWHSTIVFFHPAQIMAASDDFVGYTWTTGGELLLTGAGFGGN